MCVFSHTTKWNESGFRPPLRTYRLNLARRTSWGWWDYWDDTVLQTQDSKFEPWRSEAEHATSRSRRLPEILTYTRGWGGNIFVSFKPPWPGTEPRTLAWKAAVLTTTPGPPPFRTLQKFVMVSTLIGCNCWPCKQMIANHPIYGGDWLSCDPFRGSHDSQLPHIRKHLCPILWQLWFICHKIIHTI